MRCPFPVEENPRQSANAPEAGSYGKEAQMGVTIKELLQLDIMKDFSVIAGKSALERIVCGTGILDFELSEELSSYRARAAEWGRKYFQSNIAFDKDSLVLSSLLFTKGDSALLYEAVEKLIELDVSCLAYKPVIFEELPGEVIRLAEKNNFCIIRFGGGEWFEDVILAVVSQIKADDRGRKVELLIKRILGGSLTPEQILRDLEFINPAYSDYLFAANITLGKKDKKDGRTLKGKPAQSLAERQLSQKLSAKCSLCRYEDSLFFLISGETDSRQRYTAVLEDALYELGIQLLDYTAGFGTIHPAEELDRALTEAHYARMAAEIEACGQMEYENMGLYRMIFANRDPQGLHQYMAEYFAPIYQHKDNNSAELFRTAVSYVQAKGDLSLTAQALCCHKNTIRYRIAKLQEKLCGREHSRDFFTELSLAVKIYLAETYTEGKWL